MEMDTLVHVVLSKNGPKNSNNSIKIDKLLNLVILAVQYIVQSEMIEFRLKLGLYGFISSTYMRNSQNSMLYMD